MAIWPLLEPGKNNSASIQESIDRAAGIGGGEVLISNGRWPIEHPLRVADRVALRGESLLGSVLLLDESMRGPAIRLEPAPGSRGPVEGVALEDLTLDGGTSGTGGAAAGVACEVSSQYCLFRRMRFVGLGGPAISIQGNRIEALCIEQTFVERCAWDGIVLTASEEASAVFVTEVVVRDFGLSDRREVEGAAAIRLGARAMLAQIHLHPVEANSTGIAFQRGSEFSTASNVYIGLRGGIPLGFDASVHDIAVEGVLVRDLDDRDREEVFP